MEGSNNREECVGRRATSTTNDNVEQFGVLILYN